MAWTFSLLLAYVPIGVAVDPPTCKAICSGLSCDNYSPATCALIFQKSGCRCNQGCQCNHIASRRLYANESCPATCGVEGTTCDDATFREMGMTCNDLENVDLFRSPCVCDDCACTSNAIPERLRYCAAYHKVAALDTRHAIASALAVVTQGQCGELQLASKLDIHIHDQLTITAATNISIDGASSRLLATHSNRLIMVSPAASLDLFQMTLEGGYADVLGGCVAVGFDASLVVTNVIFNRCASFLHGGCIAAFTQATVFLYNSSMLNCVAADRGGGVFGWWRTKIMLSDSSIVNSSAVDGGGIFVTEAATIELRGSAHLSNCISKNSGGGIYTYGWYISISLFDNSKIERCTSTYGGAAHTDFYSSISLTNNASVVDCVARDSGGGLFLFWNGFLYIRGSSSIRRNTALFYGAGILIFSESIGELADHALVESNIASHSGGGIVLYEEAYLLVGAEASIIDNTAMEEAGGLLVVGATATLKGNMTSNFAAFRGGGGIRGYNGGSVSILGGSISNNIAQESGGGLYLDQSSTLTVINASISRNVAISGDGGGICIFGDDSIVRFVGNAQVSKNAAMMIGGGVRADGTMILHAGVHISSNFAGASGGGIAAFGRLYISSASAKWVEVDTDFVAEGGVDESWIGILDVENRFPYDARGHSTLLMAAEGIMPAVLCLQTGRQYSFEGYSSLATGWSGGTATYVQIMDDGTPSASVSLAFGSHAETRQFWNHADVVDTSAENAAVFITNNFGERGAGIFLSEDANLFAYGTNISGNRAMQGGGIHVSTFAKADVFNCTLSDNAALGSGGGILVATLATVQMHDCRVTSNTAARGAGANLDTARTVRFDKVSFEQNFADEGGAVAILKTDLASFIDTTFRSNTATDHGAALSITDSYVGVGRSRFSQNVAETGDGGVVASYGRSDVQFFPTNSSMQTELVACPRTQVDVITDMSFTTATCVPTDFSGTGNTCDYWPRAVSEFLLVLCLSKSDLEVATNT